MQFRVVWPKCWFFVLFSRQIIYLLRIPFVYGEPFYQGRAGVNFAFAFVLVVYTVVMCVCVRVAHRASYHLYIC